MSSPFATDHLRSFRHLLVGAPLAAVLLAAAPAFAQDPPSNCPPGSWFCAEAEKAPPKAPAAAPAPAAPAAAAVKGELEPLPPIEALPPPPPPGPPPAPPGVMIYRPGTPPPVVIYQAPPAYRPPPPPPYYYRPRPAKRSVVGQPNEWGLNTRLEIAPTGGGSASTQPMMGWGFGLRYKPIPAFGLEAGFDFMRGRDYQNDWRQETEFTVNAMVFLNPRSRVQFYLLAGVGGAWANVAYNSGGSNGNWDPGYPTTSYTYFGGQAGGGLEFRIARHFAMNVDVRGFLRSRTDSNAAYQPEFTNAQTGQTTNTSDGALFTAGMTFYF